MPETILIDAQAGTLPEGFCPSGPTALQQLLDQFVSSTQWSLAVGIRFFNYGDTEPTPDYRIWPWLKTIAGVQDRWYSWFGSPAGWYCLHEIPPGPNGLRVGWADTPTALLTFDGGEVGVATLTTGPFWEIDEDFAGRSPMAPGEILSANPAKALSVNEDYGEGAHVQTADEVGTHDHLPQPAAMSISPGSGTVEGIMYNSPGSGNAHADLIIAPNTYTSEQEAMPIIHPVRGLYQIKRTIRKYRRAT